MIIIGHRGARGLAPENTLASIKKAIKYKVDYIELDVRITSDNEIILSHDSAIKSKSGDRSLKISESKFKDLLLLKDDLTTLDDALNFIDHKFKVYLDIKATDKLNLIADLISANLKKGWVNEDFLIASFSQSVLVFFNNEQPNLQRVVIEKWSGVVAHIRAKKVKTKIICMNQKWLWSGFISSVHKGGYTLYAYTINNPKRAKKFAYYGLSGIVTDYPDLFEKDL